jgi:predicted metal-dependent hydrolase
MTTSSRHLKISGIEVEVIRKAIKNLHLGVYPPEGRVRVAAPLALTDAAVRVAVIGKLRWIRKQQAAFVRQPRETPREMVRGESHYYQGRRYRLALVETQGRCDVVLRRNGILELQVRPKQTAEQRERVLWRWYGERLNVLVPPSDTSRTCDLRFRKVPPAAFGAYWMRRPSRDRPRDDRRRVSR